MAKGSYTANRRINVSGNRFKPGDTLELTDAEAKQLGTAVTKGKAGATPPKPAGTTPNTNTTGGAALDEDAFTPAALAKARELKMAPDNFARRKKTTADGTKFGVEDVERIHATLGGNDE